MRNRERIFDWKKLQWNCMYASDLRLGMRVAMGWIFDWYCSKWAGWERLWRGRGRSRRRIVFGGVIEFLGIFSWESFEIDSQNISRILQMNSTQHFWPIFSRFSSFMNNLLKKTRNLHPTLPVYLLMDVEMISTRAWRHRWQEVSCIQGQVMLAIRNKPFLCFCLIAIYSRINFHN